MENRRQLLGWRWSLYAILGSCIIFIPLTLFGIEPLLAVLLFIAVGSIILLISSILYARAYWLHVLLALVVYWVMTIVLFWNYSAIRDNVRWLALSHQYKAQVLRQPALANGELKHVEWEGWGFPGAGDTTVYLVFDPADSLEAPAKSHLSGKFNGIPCEVPLVRRLESHWYSVRFYSDEEWGKCH